MPRLHFLYMPELDSKVPTRPVFARKSVITSIWCILFRST